jgi:hypothetical protein
MMNAVFGDGTPYGSCKNLRVGRNISSAMRVIRICMLGTTLAVTIKPTDATKK